MYAWFVESIKPVRLQNVLGIPSGGPRMGYVLTYRTLPDHQIATYVSGIGLTAFEYHHHGTVSDVDVRLVEFHRPDGAGRWD
jgi:hypothetical protein